MRGSSTAGCIRGMERVSQGDSAAVHESAYDRFPMSGTATSSLIAVDSGVPGNETSMSRWHRLNDRDKFFDCYVSQYHLVVDMR